MADRLDNKTREIIVEALVAAFGNLKQIEIELFPRLDRSMADIVPPTATREEGIRMIVDAADRQGWVRKLFTGLKGGETERYPSIAALLEKFPELASAPVPPGGSRRPRVEGPVRADAKHLSREHLVRPYQKLNIRQFEDLNPFGRIFRHLIESGPDELLHGEIFQNVVTLVLDSDSNFPLRIDGQPGSGKSSFLSLLYIGLELHSAGRDETPLPLYVDLRRFETLGDRGERQLAKHLKDVQRIIRQNPRRTAILLVDGLDEYVPGMRKLDQLVAEFIERTGQVRKIIGVGVSALASAEGRQPAGSLSTLGNDNAEHTVVLRGVYAKLPYVQNFLDDLLNTLDSQNQVTIRDQIIRKVNTFRLPALNLLTATSLIRRLGRPEYQAAQTLSEYYELYSSDYLGRENLDVAAEIAFRFTIEEVSPPQNKLNSTAALRLLHSHATVRDFLIARHIHRLLGSAALGDAQSIASLNHVYPHEISQFSKEVVNRSLTAQLTFLQTAETIWERADVNARSHVAYLAGRLKDFGARRKANVLLDKWKSTVADQLSRRGHVSEEELVLARTIYISLVEMGDSDAREQYLGRLISDRNWDDLNRGFHLEYYGDLPYKSLTHRDPVTGEWGRTYQYLVEKIQQPEHHLFEIEIYTLFSLAQHRHAAEILGEEQRAKLRELAGELLDTGQVRSVVLRPYLRMMREHLKQNTFRVGQVAQLLFKLKSEKRKGWERHGVHVMESVAEHVFGAILLGLLYLPPENPDWDGYDKRKILRMVYAHDAAESVTGDIVNKNDQQREEEREAFAYIGSLGTYGQVEGTGELFHSFIEFDQGATINAQIANDLDRLENLMQLYLVRAKFSDPAEFETWRADLLDAVQTQAGHQIKEIIINSFGDSTRGRE